MQKKIFFSTLFFLLLVAQACSLPSMGRKAIESFWGPSRPPLIEACYQAGSKLADLLDETAVCDTPLLVTTFVDMDDMDSSSSLGRLIPHQIASALRDRKYLTVDSRLRSHDLFVRKKSGEFILSRDLDVLNPAVEAAVFLLGTYSRIGGTVYINAKIVSARDGLVLATTDFAVSKEFLGETSKFKKDVEDTSDSPLKLLPSVRADQVDPVTGKPLPR